jgi:hypothetical protein
MKWCLKPFDYLRFLSHRSSPCFVPLLAKCNHRKYMYAYGGLCTMSGSPPVSMCYG